MRYRMIALDLDGTLLGREGNPSPRNLQALDQARQAGAIVVPCTGRAWIESRHILEKLDDSGLGVFVTGAVIGQVANGDAVDTAAIEPGLALKIVEHLHDQPVAVLVCREWGRCGHDYLVTGHGRVMDITTKWFQATGTRVHYQDHVTESDLTHTLRVGVVADHDHIRQASHTVREAFGDRTLVQILTPIYPRGQEQSIHILEVFASGVDKWRGISWVAQQHQIPAEQIVAIGDHINDVSMLRGAGCAIAMHNGVDELKRIADHVTLDCDDHGVAHAIEKLLASEWGTPTSGSPK